jgi:glycine cleavage system H protein
MNIPGNLQYTKNDEWILVDGSTGTIGISDYAQDQLSDVVYVEVSVSEGDSVAKGESFGAVESVKAASDVYMPVTGKIMAINETLEDAPELINSDPYGEAWMIKIELSDPAELDTLMDAAKYETYLEDR